MKLPVVDRSGTEVRQIDADDAVFGIAPNLAVVHQALRAQLANQRQGTHATRNRALVSGSTAKTRRQKGSGRARLGSATSSARVGGGVAHGPHPRSYRQALPKRMRRLAIRSLLSQRLGEGGLVVLTDGEFEPTTKATAALLSALGAEAGALLVTAAADANLQRGIRNLPRMHACPAHTLNVRALLDHDRLILTEGAVQRVGALWGGARAHLRRAPIPGEEA